MTGTSETGRILQGTLPRLESGSLGKLDKPTPESFSDLLAKGIDSVQDLSEQSDQLAVDLALGQPVELHQVMLAASKAQIAMELLIEIRNKLIEAYQDISRMPV